MGYFAKNGSYVIDWKKVRTYAVPEDLDQFKVCQFLPAIWQRTMQNPVG